MGRRRLSAAIRRLNDAFQLRDCETKQAIHFADQGSLFPIVRPAGCLRFEIGTCSGPCNEGTSRLDYARQIRAARAFLDGRDEVGGGAAALARGHFPEGLVRGDAGVRRDAGDGAEDRGGARRRDAMVAAGRAGRVGAVPAVVTRGDELPRSSPPRGPVFSDMMN
jgi:hypothetical protein